MAEASGLASGERSEMESEQLEEDTQLAGEQQLFSRGNRNLMGRARELNEEDIEKLKFISFGIEKIAQKVARETTLLGIKARIKDRLSSIEETVTFLFHVLDEIGFSWKNQKYQPDLISDYDLRARHPGVDFRLTILSFIDDLNEIDYKTLRDSVCCDLRVSEDRCKNRCGLAALLMEELHLDHTSTAHVSEMYKLSKVYNRSRFFVEYCQRQNITLDNVSIDSAGSSEPVVKLRRITESASHKQEHGQHTRIEEEESKEQPSRDPEDEQPEVQLVSVQQSEEKHKPCRKCEVIFGVVLLLILACIGGVIIYSSIKARNLEISHDEAGIMDYDNIAPLSDDGFPANLESVDLTLSIMDDDTKEDVVVNIYKGDCDSVTVTHTPLPIRPQNELWAPDGFHRQPYNYGRQDTPIYGLKGSHLQFNVTFAMTTTELSGRDHNTCLRLRIFTDHDSYWQATEPGETPSPIVDGQKDQSDCLPIGEPVSWTYTFQTSSYVYATIDVGEDTSVNGSIAGIINSYNPGSLPSTVSCSPLTRDSLTCNIKLCGNVCYSFIQSPLQCIYLQQEHSDSNSNDDSTPLRKVLYKSKLPIRNTYFLISVSLAAFIVLVFIAIACFKFCCHFLSPRCTREAKQVSYSRQCSNDSRKLLLGSTN